VRGSREGIPTIQKAKKKNLPDRYRTCRTKQNKKTPPTLAKRQLSP